MNLFAAVHAAFLGAPLVGSPRAGTHAFLTPHLLARHLPDLNGVTVVVAGDRLSRALHDRATASGATVHHYYGAAELSFVAWGAHADDLRPFPGIEVSVRAGEVWVRSPYLCLGYDGPPGPLRRDEDGFATVGDRGVLEDGRLVVQGRDDVVVTGGVTVPVAEVEAVLLPRATGEVVVLGVPHDELGAVVAVVLTTRSDHRSLLQVARSTLRGGHRPRLWFHVDDLPVTPAGKVDRAALVSLVSGADGRSHRLL
jgi:acyl-CoA synthetase (AMP-forming)/AMP-acid ligase II